jgi:hypothetical protein
MDICDFWVFGAILDKNFVFIMINKPDKTSWGIGAAHKSGDVLQSTVRQDKSSTKLELVIHRIKHLSEQLFLRCQY